jgi:hypothetical protein
MIYDEEHSMPATGQSHIRIARPSRDLASAEHFWVSGLGLSVLFRAESAGRPDKHDLLMVGWPDASWPVTPSAQRTLWSRRRRRSTWTSGFGATAKA